jgi:hypothetical protein
MKVVLAAALIFTLLRLVDAQDKPPPFDQFSAVSGVSLKPKAFGNIGGGYAVGRVCHPPSRWHSILLPNCVFRGRSSTHSERNVIHHRGSGHQVIPTAGKPEMTRCALIVGTRRQQKCSGSFRAMLPGDRGNVGSVGNVESVTCRPHYSVDETNPPLSAYVRKPLILIVLSG